jgi:hypothetical protein
MALPTARPLGVSCATRDSASDRRSRDATSATHGRPSPARRTHPRQAPPDHGRPPDEGRGPASPPPRPGQPPRRTRVEHHRRPTPQRRARAQRIRLVPRTVRATRALVDRYLRSKFGRSLLRKLRTSDLDPFCTELRRASGLPPKGLTRRRAPPGTLLRVHTTIRAALEQAVRWEWVLDNPASRTEPSRSRTHPSACPVACIKHRTDSLAHRRSTTSDRSSTMADRTTPIMVGAVAIVVVALQAQRREKATPREPAASQPCE